MSKVFYKYKPQHSELFKDVVFVVEATDYEIHTLWRNHYHEPRKDYPIVKWEEESTGKLIHIGELDNRPVNIAISYAKLNGKRVMFYEAVSQVVDYEMVEKWIKHFSLHIRYDSNTRWAQCDAENFHNCIDSIREG